MLSPQVFGQATSGATGAAQKTVSLRLLRGIQVPRLSATEQVAIAERLDSLSAETSKLEDLLCAKRSALDELKKSLLHQAFSGQL
jgi:type I restriction enzyme, S subunit